MKKFSVEIEGICPIIFNRFTDEAIEAMEKRTSGKKKSKEAKIKEASEKVYKKSPRGNLYIPKDNLKKSMLEGCGMAGFKIGRRGAMPYFRATVFVEDDLDLSVKKEDGVHECTGRIPPGPRGVRVMIRRPFLDTGWKTAFTLLATDERVDSSIIEGSLKEAGLLVGLCDHRPEYGRFKFNKFDELK